ncbi:hypothetical protein HQ590_09350 [bacterium]|nr:hypothetical protein [bacterium]
MNSQLPSPERPPVGPAARFTPRLSAEAEAEIARFGRHLTERRIAPNPQIPHWMRWVRRFLARGVATADTEDAVQVFMDHLASRGLPAWQLTQAERSVRFFLGGWRTGTSAPVSRLQPAADGTVAVADALAAIRDLARLRHYAHRTENTYAEWVSRYFRYLDEVAGDGSKPRHAIDGASMRGFLIPPGDPPGSVGLHPKPGIQRPAVSRPGGPRAGP